MAKRINILNALKLFLLLFILLLFFPYFKILLLSLEPNNRYINFIIENGILLDYVINTVELIIKVGLFSSIIGFLGAYFMTFYDFKFKKIINLLFILPLSIPIYLGAYVYSDLFYRIPLLDFLFKNDFTMNSAVFIYVIFLYPYVYLTTYAYLRNYMQEYIEAAQMLKLSNFSIFWRVVFPLSKTILFSSCMFVIYESLSDFAVSEYYGIQTLSRAFNDARTMSSGQSALAKLALALIAIIAVIILIEKFLRKKTRLNSTVVIKSKLIKTKVGMKTVIYSFYALIISIGFLLPFQRILYGAIRKREYFLKREILMVSWQTFTLSMAVVVTIVIVAMFLSSMLKYLKTGSKKYVSLISTLGYMVPSMVLALGVYATFFNVDLLINPLLEKFNLSTFIFTSTRTVLIIGLSFKFLAIAFNNFEQTYKKLDPYIFEAALTLQQNPIKVFFKVDLHFLSKTGIYIIILVILDVFKELTLAFTLSPFNYRTVSTEIYHYMANEMQQVAYVPGIIIITICATCIIILDRGLLNDKNKQFDI